MPPTERTKRAIWLKAGATCAICRDHLTEATVDGTGTHFLGEVAHIVAEQLDGPRGGADLSLQERNGENNLLLLCLRHHTLIDDDPSEYTVERLHSTKTEHESWVAAKRDSERVWQTELHNLYYINVPRLNLLAASAGCSLDLSSYQEISVLHELGVSLNRLMAGFQHLLSQVELMAVDLDQAISGASDPRGMIVSFDRDFRTKNVRLPSSRSGYTTAGSGDLRKDPHVYTDVGGYRVIVKINPRWITTTTAFSEFRPSSGKNKFGGLGIINSVDAEAKIISVTPYVMGLPSNPFMKQFYQAMEANR